MINLEQDSRVKSEDFTDAAAAIWAAVDAGQNLPDILANEQAVRGALLDTCVPTVYVPESDGSLSEEMAPAGPSTFIMRDEGSRFVFKMIREKSNTAGLQYNDIYKRAWSTFNTELITTMLHAFSTSAETRRVRIESYPMDLLKRHVLAKLGNRFAISTDPCIQNGDHIGVADLGMSRVYQIGGVDQMGWGERPGHLPIDQQIYLIKEAYFQKILPKIGPDHRLEWIEDDIWTGGTAKTFITRVQDEGIPIGSVLACFQVGTPDIGVPVDAVITHSPADALDFADHRDYLVGGHESGLVVLHSQGTRPRGDGDRGDIYCHVAKAPYLLPFVSPGARASIPSIAEVQFSKDILHANVMLYETLAKETRQPILLKHVNPHLQELMMVYGFTPDAPMEQLCTSVLENFDMYYSRIFGAAQQYNVS